MYAIRSYYGSSNAPPANRGETADRKRRDTGETGLHGTGEDHELSGKTGLTDGTDVQAHSAAAWNARQLTRRMPCSIRHVQPAATTNESFSACGTARYRTP